MGFLQIVRRSLDDSHNRRFLFIFIATVLVMSYPLFTGSLYMGHDWTYHMLRIQSLYEGVLTGQFPIRVNPLFLNGYGYASSLFYPDLFLYIPVLFQLIGFGIEASYKLYLILTLAAGFLTAYFCGKGITKSSYAGIVGAVVFSLSQYHLQNIYLRFAVGEVQAFVFLPFIAYGLYNLIYEDFDKPWLFVAGFTGLIYSHLLSTVLAGMVCIGVCLLGMKSILRYPQKIIRLLIAAILTLGLTCTFWMPMAEQLLANRFEFQHLVVNWVHTRAVRIPVMFANAFVLKGRDVSIGISLTLLCLLLVFLPKASFQAGQKKIIGWSMLTGFGLLFITSDLFPWQIMPPQVNSIQFPWRFYALASLFLSLGIGMMAEVLFSKRFKIFGLILIVLFMGGSAITVITNSVDFKEGAIDLTPQYYQTPINTNAISGGEWLPAGVEPASISYKPLVVETNTGDSLEYGKYGLKTIVDYDADYEYIDVPSINYRGYSVVFKDQAGNTVNVPYSNEGDNKSIRVYSNYVSAPGTLTVDYTGTTIQKASLALNVFFVLAVLLLIKWHKWIYKKIPVLQGISPL